MIESLEAILNAELSGAEWKRDIRFSTPKKPCWHTDPALGSKLYMYHTNKGKWGAWHSLVIDVKGEGDSPTGAVEHLVDQFESLRLTSEADDMFDLMLGKIHTVWGSPIKELRAILPGRWREKDGFYTAHLPHHNIVRIGKDSKNSDWGGVVLCNSRATAHRGQSPSEVAKIAADIIREETVPTGVDAEMVSQLRTVLDVDWKWSKSTRTASYRYGSMFIEAEMWNRHGEDTCSVDIRIGDDEGMIGHEFQGKDAADKLVKALTEAKKEALGFLRDLRKLIPKAPSKSKTTRPSPSAPEHS